VASSAGPVALTSHDFVALEDISSRSRIPITSTMAAPAARLKYVKSNDYEPIRAAAGVNLLTDEGDSWGPTAPH
jgi:hypothetical protein